MQLLALFGAIPIKLPVKEQKGPWKAKNKENPIISASDEKRVTLSH